MTDNVTLAIASHPAARWLAQRMARLAPLPDGRVRVVGLVVIDQTLSDPDTSARASWIGDGNSPSEVLDERGDDLDRFDVVAAVTWLQGRPTVTVVLVNP